MNDFRTDLTNAEKIAREVSGIDSGATFFGPATPTVDEMIEARHREKWNEGVKKIEDKFNEHEQNLQKAADEYAKNLNGVQIMPIGNYVLVKPFNENPFQKVKVDERTGLILDTGGLLPEYKRNDSGEYEEAEQMIKVGVIVGVGPECKWLREGDTIMWAKMSEVVVPFYNFGFRLVNETRAICVINDDLEERFNQSK